MIRELFPANRIRLDLSSADKAAMFEELVDAIAATSSSAFPREEALACVMERELLMSTAIRKGVAIPHGKSPRVETIVGAIGVSRAGIDYDSFDEEPVRLAFMIVSPTRNPELHLKALKRLAAIIDMPGFTDALMGSPTPEAASDTIAAYEQRLESA